jgi:hypothetical protein
VIDDADLGDLTAVTICHDGSGASPGWHVSHVLVQPLGAAAPGGGSGAASGSQPPSLAQSRPSTAGQQQPQQQACARAAWQDARGTAGGSGPVYIFPCDAWLDDTLGGGLTKRRLPAARCMRCVCGA